MKRFNYLLILIILIVVAVVAGSVSLLVKNNNGVDIRRLRYSFVIENLTNSACRDFRFSVYAPANHENQKLINIASTNTFDKKIKSENTELTLKNLALIPPYGSLFITLDTEVSLKRSTGISIFDGGRKYLVPDRFIPCDDPEIKKVAATLKGRSKEETVNNILNWIKSEVRFSDYSGRRLGAKAAIKNKYGDCTELMDIFLALARASSIPCRGISGFICDSDMILKPDGYHNWAEYHDGISWIGVDPSYGKKDDELSDYIAFRIFEPGYEGDGSLFEIPERFKGYIKVRMNT